MGSVFARNVPDNLVQIIDTWRKQQVPMLNRSQTVTHIIKEWVERHEKEFVRDGVITDEQMSLFNNGK